MTQQLRVLVGMFTVLLLSGCAAGPSRNCATPAMPPPPPPSCGCCCGHPGQGPNGFGAFGHDDGGGPRGPRRLGGPGGGEFDGPPGGGPPRAWGPAPAEVFEACSGKKANDACKVQHGGWELSGICLAPAEPNRQDESQRVESKDDRLACAPPRPPAPPRGSDGPKPASGDSKGKKP